MPHIITLDATDVRRYLPNIDALSTMRSLFSKLGNGEAVQPPQTLTLLPENKGDFISYLGASSGIDVFGAKLSPYLLQPEKSIVTAWTLLLSSDTGLPLMLCDSGELTTLRTAATTALAVSYLATEEAKTLAIIGAGNVAWTHLGQAIGLRPWQDIRVFSRSLAQDNAAQTKWRSFDSRISVAPTAAAATDKADVVLLCTSSGTPVIAPETIAPGTLVTSISTNVVNAHEVPPSLLLESEVYCDYRATTPIAAGEMKLATLLGWNPDSIQGDLAELAIGTSSLPTGDRPVFFRSIGLGLEDIFMAHAIYQATQA